MCEWNLERNMINQANLDENLRGVALEVKQRYYKKFAVHLTTESTTQSKSLYQCFGTTTLNKLR